MALYWLLIRILSAKPLLFHVVFIYDIEFINIQAGLLQMLGRRRSLFIILLYSTAAFLFFGILMAPVVLLRDIIHYGGPGGGDLLDKALAELVSFGSFAF